MTAPMPTPLPTAAWTDAQVLDLFAEVVARSLRIDAARVTSGATFTDLGAESLDLVEITLDVELAFGVLWPERQVLEIAREELGPAAVLDEGRITALGMALLRDRLPAAACADLPAEATIADATAAFLRIDVWVHVIRMLLAAAPRCCPTCGAALVLGSPARVACRPCGREFDLLAGDEVNRAWIRQWGDGRARTASAVPE